MTVRYRVGLLSIVAAIVFVLGGSTPARADDCFDDIADCYAKAASASSVWGMWLQGLDCELTFADCTRRVIIGR